MDTITEEQRQRAEANRLAALEKKKRKAAVAAETYSEDKWKLFRCRKISTLHDTPSEPGMQVSNISTKPPKDPSSPRFRVRLEICSPDSFCVTPEPLPPFPYPGETECLHQLTSWISSVLPTHYTQNQVGGMACVYELREYETVQRWLRTVKAIELQDIPWRTLSVVQKFSACFRARQWIPCMPEHLSSNEVDALMNKLPQILLDSLLPFQLDGVRFGLQRGGTCLIADEMGLGKTIQAIAVACCFMNEGPLLVVCPAILRFSWAEELEHWLPFCSPKDIHLVFGHQDNPARLTRLPKVVVISYTMLHRLQKSIVNQEWAFLIIDECHHIRCAKKTGESEEIKAILNVATKVKRKVLLSGTPSLSRPYDIFHQVNILWPGLLGIDKYEFARNYCERTFVRGVQGKVFQDFAKGIRLEELNVLLKQTVMIRRLKEHVLVELPPKRRQIIRLMLKRSDIASAVARTVDNSSHEAGQESLVLSHYDTEDDNDADDLSETSDDFYDDSCCPRIRGQLSNQELGIAKLSGFCEWLSVQPVIIESEGGRNVDTDATKMIIFAHHLRVLDGVQEFLCGKGVGFVRIDGSTLARDRQSAMQAFRSCAEIKIALIGITAGGVGIDFSTAQNVVFLELPQSVSEMLQAEDRAHRRGQVNAVNIYIFCAKDTLDEFHWQNLNKSLQRVSSLMNGKYDAVKEIEVERVSDLQLNLVACKNEVANVTTNLNVGGCNEFLRNETTDLERDAPSATLQPDVHIREIPEKEGSSKQVSSASDVLVVDDYASNDIVGNGIVQAFEIQSEDKLVSNKVDKDEPHGLSPEQGKNEPVEQTEADTSCLISKDTLRFEVSHNTGRVHLYSCISGRDSRPRPLFENFRPEELESLSCAPNGTKKTNLIKENPALKNVLQRFAKEWSDLRPIEQKKLQGKPLQLPVTLELCYLKESFSHGSGGLLKGGSKRRVTPLHEISHELPASAVWKKISLCSGNKKEKQYMQGWSINGEPLCKLCQTPCNDKVSKTPEFFEDLFCNLNCFEEYRTRTSRQFIREELFKIEHGICRMCKLDCHKLVQCIKPLSVSKRQMYIKNVAPKLASYKKIFDKLVHQPIEGNAWHADHIIPVHQGGGECNLENIRTLCVACHSEVTAAQRSKKRLETLKAKKQLTVLMNELKDGNQLEQVDINMKVQSHLMVEDNTIDNELMVKVPGSAYSAEEATTAESDEQNSSKDEL